MAWGMFPPMVTAAGGNPNLAAFIGTAIGGAGENVGRGGP